ncbi:potassium-transporting ATPase subunit KdpC [Clostridium sp. MCC353]|uniref:potassium-transporting ATPase subunit KdpC n=1 Tax=Clostridium sp. MCC353 TaxID=2592646 RepID=UPI001C019EA0|nr:potassium-transporting ATPase subunit KdpC [Clostridium sp. MCC353]MBT9777107.1 potassium-transporting ATPase subunit KdpC [Clostridium sp. MCC353]
MKTIKSVVPRAFGFFLVLTVICGVIYPLTVTGIAKVFFQKQAEGSIIEIDGVKYGSELLAQEFTSDTYLWGRPMITDISTYTDDEGNVLMYAGASNKSPAGEELEAVIAERVERMKAAHPEQADQPVPSDLVTVSGSGLDPEISPAAANYQVQRISKARGIPEEEVKAVIGQYTKERTFGIFGEPRVNVLKVNLALDGILKG